MGLRKTRSAFIEDMGMQTPRHEPIIIELDEPTPRWFRWGALVMTLVIVTLVLAPWIIEIDKPEEADASQTQPSRADTSSPVCQPTLDLPSFAEPAASVALPSWMRLCDWFIEPGTQPVVFPTQPPNTGPFTD
jgi:hypothetical protein